MTGGIGRRFANQPHLLAALQSVQEYRQFDFLSTWEGVQYALPGDEKGAAK